MLDNDFQTLMGNFWCGNLGGGGGGGGGHSPPDSYVCGWAQLSSVVCPLECIGGLLIG